jgi:hypothetical protein
MFIHKYHPLGRHISLCCQKYTVARKLVKHINRVIVRTSCFYTTMLHVSAITPISINIYFPSYVLLEILPDDARNG